MVKEESLLLRSLVFLLASIAITSFDLALGSSLSLPLMPLFIMGSLWSYICRHSEKKLIVHLALLGFVCIFACYWVAQGQFYNFTGDTRTWIPAIAFSFIVQTIGLWQAYSRSVLSSSIMISSFQMVGAILFAHDIKFLPLLALFILIVVPTLWLICRSTINLPPIGISVWPIPNQLNERHLPWWYLLKIVAITLTSSVIFALYLLTNEPIVAAIFPGATAVKSVPQSTVQSIGALTPQQTNQAVQNILATTDRPLNTLPERIQYVTNYLQNRTQPGTCTEKKGCDQEFLQQIEQLAKPCHENNPQCQKDWKFIADQQELAVVYNQLNRSIYSNNSSSSVPIVSNLPTGNKLAQSSPASTSATSEPNTPIAQPVTRPDISTTPVVETTPSAKVDYNPDTNKYEITPPIVPLTNESLPNSAPILQNPSPASSTPVISSNETVSPTAPSTNYGANNNRKDSQIPNEAPQPQPISGKIQADNTDTPKVSPPPRPTKNQWLNFLSATLLVFLVLGTIWYFQRQQPSDENVVRKKLKSQGPMSIEQIYEFMLQELRLGGKVKLPYVTESEFARLIKLYYPGALGKVIAEISGDYVAWRYGQQPANEAIMQQNFNLFCQLHNSMQSAKISKSSTKSKARK
jgi:hypothetical protein